MVDELRAGCEYATNKNVCTAFTLDEGHYQRRWSSRCHGFKGDGMVEPLFNFWRG